MKIENAFFDREKEDNTELLSLFHILKISGENTYINEYSPIYRDYFKNNIESEYLTITDEYGGDDGIVFTVESIQHNNIEKRITEICQTESDFSNTLDSQEREIYTELEKILEKRDGKIISYPRDFSFTLSEIENYEYVKILLLLEIRGRIKLTFPETSMPGMLKYDIFFMKTYESHGNIKFKINSNSSITGFGRFKLDKTKGNIHIGSRIITNSDLHNYSDKKGFVALGIIIENKLEIIEDNDSTKRLFFDSWEDMNKILQGNTEGYDKDLSTLISRARGLLEKTLNTKIKITHKGKNGTQYRIIQ